MKKNLGIKVISESCGILPHTIRVWEQRYQVFEPDRDENGQRLYSQEDLRKAKLLAKLTSAGHSISNLAQQSIEELENLTNLLPDKTKSVHDDHLVNTQRVLDYLAENNIDSVAHELQHLRMSLGARDFIFQIVLPALRETGNLVATGKISVTQEHIISTIIRSQLAQIYLPNVGSQEREMALATPEGNLHELPILIADILCRANRVSTRYLGSSHPADCLGEAMTAIKSPYLILGVLSSDEWNYHESIIPFLQKMDRRLKRDIHLILGGAMPMEFPKFIHIKDISCFNSLDDFDRFLREWV